MSSDGLDFDIEVLADGLVAIDDESRRLASDQQAVADRITDAEERATHLAERLGIEVQLPDWDDIVIFDEALTGRLIDPDEAEAIERRYTDGFSIRTSLDRYDVTAGVAIGIAASLVDWLVVRMPSPYRWSQVEGASELTRRLRMWAVDNDNALSDLAKVPFDRPWDPGVPGMGPINHRVMTFGHDPLLGLVLGSLDIIQGTMRAASTQTRGITVLPGRMAPVTNPLEAVGLEVLHLLSDVITSAGLPVPGWTALVAAGGDTAGIARKMYVNGYDTWHFMTMSTSVAAIELLTRAYFGMRRFDDEEYREVTDSEAGLSALRIADYPRFQSVSLIGHSVATAGNVARVLAAGGNPLAVNYPQWLAFASSALGAIRRGHAPVDLAARSAMNRLELATGWARLDLELTESGFPRP